MIGWRLQRCHYPTDGQLADHIHNVCVESGDDDCPSIGEIRQDLIDGEQTCRNDSGESFTDWGVRSRVMRAETPRQMMNVEPSDTDECGSDMISWTRKEGNWAYLLLGVSFFVALLVHMLIKPDGSSRL
jgi:hypothetical protein